mmetsp:Transcript_69378/g.225277  ORF Transcript_69378/g.225277 Transcript_69378/m.225277 type:complete len:202 (-) Transcript_69378:39-644(-)
MRSPSQYICTLTTSTGSESGTGWMQLKELPHLLQPPRPMGHRRLRILLRRKANSTFPMVRRRRAGSLPRRWVAPGSRRSLEEFLAGRCMAPVSSLRCCARVCAAENVSLLALAAWSATQRCRPRDAGHARALGRDSAFVFGRSRRSCIQHPSVGRPPVRCVAANCLPLAELTRDRIHRLRGACDATCRQEQDFKTRIIVNA